MTKMIIPTDFEAFPTRYQTHTNRMGSAHETLIVVASRVSWHPSTVQISQVWPLGFLGSNRIWELWCVTCCFFWFGFCLHRTRTVHPGTSKVNSRTFRPCCNHWTVVRAVNLPFVSHVILITVLMDVNLAMLIEPSNEPLVCRCSPTYSLFGLLGWNF